MHLRHTFFFLLRSTLVLKNYSNHTRLLTVRFLQFTADNTFIYLDTIIIVAGLQFCWTLDHDLPIVEEGILYTKMFQC